MTSVYNGPRLQNHIKKPGETRHMPIRLAGHADAHDIAPGDPVAGVTDGNTRYAYAASAWTWAGDAAATRATFKADFEGVSNSQYLADAPCVVNQDEEIQVFIKNDLQPEFDRQLVTAGTWVQDAFYGPAEDPVAAGQLSDTYVEPCPEAEAIFQAKYSSGDTASDRIILRFLHADR